MLWPAGKPSGSCWTCYLRSSTAARTPRNPHGGRGKIPLCRFAFRIWEMWVITSTLVQIQKLQEGRKEALNWEGGGGERGGTVSMLNKGREKGQHCPAEGCAWGVTFPTSKLLQVLCRQGDAGARQWWAETSPHICTPNSPTGSYATAGKHLSFFK